MTELYFSGYCNPAFAPRAIPAQAYNMPARRTKTLSIRISEVEYETLKSFRCLNGTRSVSASAREALRRLIQDSTPPSEDDVTKAIRSLDQRLAALQSSVSSLSRTVSERLLGETEG